MSQDLAPAAGIAWDDTVLPFQLDASDIRGRVARLDDSLGRILAQHAYPPAIEALVAETALLAALIGPTVKRRWKLSIQVRGRGPARIVAADYYAPERAGEAGRLRAWASFDAARLDPLGPPFAQVGEGYFALLIDQGQGSLPYQGITPLAGGSLRACAETYFAQSEQIPTRFALAFGRSRLKGGREGWRAGGILLQHMPEPGQSAAQRSAAQKSAAQTGAQTGAAREGSGEGGLLGPGDLLDGEAGENWTRANLLLDTVEPLELVGPQVQPTDLLLRLFHQEGPRIFDAQGLAFGCSCSEDKVRRSLSIYGRRDIAHMTTEAGVVTADCQFCGAHYEFDPATLGQGAAQCAAQDGAQDGAKGVGGAAQ